MSFTGKFSLGGKTYNILQFRQGLQQETDYNGKPKEKPHSGIFTLAIETTSDENLLEWMVSETMTKAGKVTFSKRTGPGKMYDFEFADAYCIAYEERYSHTGIWPLTTILTISAGVLRSRGTVYERPWKLTDIAGTTAAILQPPSASPSEQEQNQEPEEEKKPSISSTKWMDENGENVITKIASWKKMSLWVQTSDAEPGEELKVTMKPDKPGAKETVLSGIVQEDLSVLLKIDKPNKLNNWK